MDKRDRKDEVCTNPYKQSVVWKDFGFENDYEENIRLDEYKHIGPFTFDWKEYESTLLEAIDNLKQPQQSL